MKRLILASLVLLSGLFAIPSAAAADNFDGTYKLKMTPGTVTRQKGATEFDDALVVVPTEMVSEAFAGYGFMPGNREVAADTGAFISNMTSRTKGTLKYDAVIVGSAIRGKLVWTKSDGTVWFFTFEGTKQQD